MEARVGNNKVIHTQTLILKEGQEGWISFTVKGWEVNFKILFQNDFTNLGTGPSISVDDAKNHAIIRFTNWYYPTGTTTLDPVQVATIDDKNNLKLMATHWVISTVNRVDIQFLLEESK